jgi:hypothetical protein
LFYDDVDAPPVRQPPDFLRSVVFMVVDHLGCPWHSCALELVVAAPAVAII